MSQEIGHNSRASIKQMCYEICFRDPRVFKGRGRNILNMQTYHPTWAGHSNMHQLRPVPEHAIIGIFLAMT
jgi:hypothetical protein